MTATHDHHGQPPSARVIHLRYAGKCASCGRPLQVRDTAWWDAAAHSTTCLTCRPAADVDRGQPMPPAALAVGEPGGSAQRRYEKLRQRREAKIDADWGPLAGVAKRLSTEPQSTAAWAKGADGERRLARHLAAALGNRAVLLHDRKVPGTRGNIDHIAVAASGVWVIDAKNYKGRVERRDVGGWFTRDERLYVGNRDRTKAVAGLGWQIDAVRTALDGAAVPITGVVCLIENEWKLFAKPFRINGVWVTWGKKLSEMIAAPGKLNPAQVTGIAGHLATSLPPAVTTPSRAS